MNPLLLAILLASAPEALADGDTPTLGDPGADQGLPDGDCVALYPRSSHSVDTPTANTNNLAQEEITCRKSGKTTCDVANVISQQAALCVAAQAGLTRLDSAYLSAPNAYRGNGKPSPGLVWTVYDWSRNGQQVTIDATTAQVLDIRPIPMPVPGRPATVGTVARRARVVPRKGWT